jgi:RIP metalloprotease RseP
VLRGHYQQVTVTIKPKLDTDTPLRLPADSKTLPANAREQVYRMGAQIAALDSKLKSDERRVLDKMREQLALPDASADSIETSFALEREEKNRPRYLLGIQPTPDIIPVGVGQAARDSIRYPVEQTKVILGGFRDIFTGKEEIDAGGPVRIVSEFKSAFDRGLPDGIKLLMMLSVYLGLFNLFPLPALDGGRLVFLAYEMITRRRANPKIETMVHMGGIMVLMVVMILVTLGDVGVF